MIADNLKALMDARGYTQKDIACMAKAAPSTVSGWLKLGHMPSEDMLHTLARILEAPVGVLVDDNMRMQFLRSETMPPEGTTSFLLHSINWLRTALDIFERDIQHT